MTGTALGQVILVAAGCALLVGLAGLATSWLTRTRSLRWHLAVLVLVAVIAPYAGLLALTRLMFLSQHDLTVATYAGGAAAVVTGLVAYGIGIAVDRWASRVGRHVRALGSGSDADIGQPAGPAEFRQLTEALLETRADLAASREREQRLDQSRRDLVSWVSHDLRTPLAGLRAMAEAIEDGMAPDPAVYLRKITSNVDTMTLMVDDLFELSRIHAGALVPRRESVVLRDLVSEALAGADPVARTRRVRLGGEVADEIRVSADAAALSRAISNLIVNAIRHTPPDGAVEVVASVVAGGVELSVTDECGGIPDADMTSVFDVGWQGSSARSPSDTHAGALTGRAGLGLAIVRGIVEAHEGEVSVANLDPQTGCRFSIRLPAS
ncbi:sensor histidine kinase KdpD [Nocardioides sp. SLBN-35]|uniref:sensor histidine kinase n=1 Tax=Nocardioides sp. SLBN-35 TaxID=2768445 RepID=UPI0011515FAA|nr:HAMP domain-containing sensor histidine kinase [Nocardioides sp. SLBN-35]TQK68634.1 phospho-acceptor domain-containing protein [Nocardioides sp. SLBN-35]